MSLSLSLSQYTHSFCTGVILIDPDLRIHYNSLPLDLTHDLLKGRLNIIISQSFKFNKCNKNQGASTGIISASDNDYKGRVGT